MRKYLESAVAAAAALPVAAMASAPSATEAFTTAIGTATTNVGTFAAALVGLSAVGVAFMIAVKYVKKIRGAA